VIRVIGLFGSISVGYINYISWVNIAGDQTADEVYRLERGVPHSHRESSLEVEF